MATHDAPRRGYASLTIGRDRGLIWVCDISRSSSYINSDELAEDIEAFLPRLHWASSLAIGAVHGEFIQWTGDGFIAWFPLAVERELGRTASRILEAIWHFSAFINITQLCVRCPRPFRIRHGLTYEPDALVTRTTHTDGHASKIIAGRNVVLAFRLAGVESDFPNVATQLRIVQALSARTKNLTGLRRWELSEEQLLKYFKGEKLGTSGLYVSGRAKVSQSRADTWAARAEGLMAKAEAGRGRSRVETDFVDSFFAQLAQSHDHGWCRESLETYVAFASDGLAGSLGRVLAGLGQPADETKRTAPAPSMGDGAPS